MTDPAASSTAQKEALELLARGDLSGALAAAERAVAFDGHSAEAANTLGNVLLRSGRQGDAEQAYRSAIAIDPGLFKPYGNLGTLIESKGDPETAIELYRRALELNPSSFRFRSNLASALAKVGEIDRAIEAYSLSIEVQPTWVALHNLAVLYEGRGKPREALRFFERALVLDPEAAESKKGRDLARFAAERLALLEATAALAAAEFEQCFQLCEAHRSSWESSAEWSALQARLELLLGHSSRSRYAFADAVSLSPNDSVLAGNRLLALHYSLPASSPEVVTAHLEWGERFAKQTLPPSETLHRSLDRSPERPLRIGYLSGDFGGHAVSSFSLPLLEAHDRSRFQVRCYSTGEGDRFTEKFAAAAELHRVRGLSDEELAARIAADRIDVLVDLAGHTGGNRLAVFGFRPAPVQMTYLGYPNTTGVGAIDCRLTDALADPPEVEWKGSEELIRLDRPAWAYRPLVQVPRLNRRKKGSGVTFGTFSNSHKVTSDAMRLWAQMLLEVPGSRLLFKGLASHWERAREDLLTGFEVLGERGAGIDRSRIEFIAPHEGLEEHLQSYDRIDVALDTFPYHGTTTTCDALWMGIPVVSLVGDGHSSRVGASLLSAVGLGDLAVSTEDEYVQAAVSLANDEERRAELRASLRDRFSRSPLGDPQSLGRSIERVFRDRWKRWLETGTARAD